MSVDYRANYGVGYKVTEGDDLTEEDLEDGFNEYLECEIGEGFNNFEVGSGYSGNITGRFIVIREPLADGLDLTGAKERLDKEIERLKLDVEGGFGIVGGMYTF